MFISDKQTLSGYLLALTAVFFWSLNVLIAQHFATDLTPVEFAFGRWFFALLILLPFAWKNLIAQKDFLLKHGIWIIGLALSGIVLDNTLIYLAGHTIDAVNMSLLNLLGPVFLVILSAVFLKTPVQIGQIIGILIALLGVFTIITKGHWGDLGGIPWKSGDFWMLLNAFCFAVYSFLQYKRPPDVPQTTLLCATVIIGVLILAPFFFSLTPPTEWKHFSMTDYSIFIYLGIFNSVLAYLAWNNALSRIGTVKTGIIYYLQPVFSMSGAALLLGTTIGWPQIIGGLAVIAGVYIVSRHQTTASQKK